MAADIQVKIIEANELNQGAVIQAPKASGTDAYGTNYTVNHIINKDMTDTEAFNKYNARLIKY